MKQISSFMVLVFFLSLSPLFVPSLCSSQLEQSLLNYPQNGANNVNKTIVELSEKLNNLEKENIQIKNKLENLEKIVFEQSEIIKLFAQNLQNSSTIQREKFPAAVFETIQEVQAYDIGKNSNDSKIIKTIREGYKFTAFEKIGDFVRVNGDFRDGKWVASKEELWIKMEFIKKRLPAN